MYTFGLSKVSNTPAKNSPLLILNKKTPNQKVFYELYAIHKFGAKKNCTSEDKLVSAVMNLKNKAIDLGTLPKVNTFSMSE